MIYGERPTHSLKKLKAINPENKMSAKEEREPSLMLGHLDWNTSLKMKV
jgi:hypothetical protein